MLHCNNKYTALVCILVKPLGELILLFYMHNLPV